MSQNRASVWLEILGKVVNKARCQTCELFMSDFYVSVGHNVYVVAALIFGHTPIAKSFHQLRLHALSIQNISLRRSDSSNTPATSMMEVFSWLIVNYYRRELLFRYGSGSDARKTFSDSREFCLSKLKDSVQQIKNNQSILCQSSSFC